MTTDLAGRFFAGLQKTVIAPEAVYVPPVPDAEARLDAYRRELLALRLERVGRHGVYLDRTATGGGKTFADITTTARAAAMGERSLIICPTHANASEIESDLREQGADAKAYPPRMTENTRVPCPKCDGEDGNSDCGICRGAGWLDLVANCWNVQADDCEAMGLPVVTTVCPGCHRGGDCKRSGYLKQIIEASNATIAVATHSRASWAKLAELGAGRTVQAIHENAADLFSPSLDVTEADLQAAVGVLDRVLNDPKWLDWFGGDDSEETEKRREKLFSFSSFLLDTGVWMLRQIASAERTIEILPATWMSRPAGIEQMLFRASKQAGVKFGGQPWKAMLGVASGEVHFAGVSVDERFARRRSGQDDSEEDRGGLAEPAIEHCGDVLRGCHDDS